MGGIGNAAGTAFTGGGVSPEQASLAQYTFGERAVGGLGRFGESGIPMSTNATLAGGVAPAVAESTQLAGISDALANAQAQFANAQQLASKGITGQQITTASHLLGKGR